MFFSYMKHYLKGPKVIRNPITYQNITKMPGKNRKFLVYL